MTEREEKKGSFRTVHFNFGGVARIAQAPVPVLLSCSSGAGASPPPVDFPFIPPVRIQTRVPAARFPFSERFASPPTGGGTCRAAIE